MLAPLMVIDTFLPRISSRSFNAPAAAVAPAASAMVCAFSISSPMGVPNLVVADQQEIVEKFSQDTLGQLIAGLRGQSLGNGVHWRSDQTTLFPRQVASRCGLGLDRHHLDLRVDRLGHDAGSRRRAATSQRHEYKVHVRQVLHDLQGLSPHPGDQQGLIGRVDKPVALLPGQGFAMFFRLVEVVAVENQLGAQGRHGGYFQRVGVLRQHDNGPGPEYGAGVGNRLAVVS